MGWRDQAKRKKGLMDMDNSVVIEGERGGRGISGNGKIQLKKEIEVDTSPRVPHILSQSLIFTSSPSNKSTLDL